MTSHDLQDYPNALLDQLAEMMPAWRSAIAAERQRRADQVTFWNSARAMAAHVQAWQERRWQEGYSPNEEARGVDEREADDWREMRQRIHFLRRRAVRRLNHRHHRRVRGQR
jgi:hypothetical protein